MSRRKLKRLTARQAECLSLITDALDADGLPPVIREIGDSMEIASTNGVNDHLKALERKGYLNIDVHGRSRCLRPLHYPDGSPFWSRADLKAKVDELAEDLVAVAQEATCAREEAQATVEANRAAFEAEIAKLREERADMELAMLQARAYASEHMQERRRLERENAALRNQLGVGALTIPPALREALVSGDISTIRQMCGLVDEREAA